MLPRLKLVKSSASSHGGAPSTKAGSLRQQLSRASSAMDRVFRRRSKILKKPSLVPDTPMIDFAELCTFATTFSFANEIRLHRGPNGGWFVSDRHGYRLNADGIFVGTPNIAHIGAWIEDTTFVRLRDALTALCRIPEVREQLAPCVFRAADEPAP